MIIHFDYYVLNLKWNTISKLHWFWPQEKERKKNQFVKLQSSY